MKFAENFIILKLLEKKMREVFLLTLFIFAFGVGLFIFAMIQVRKFRRSQGK